MTTSRVIVLACLLGTASAGAQKKTGFCDRIKALTGDPSVASAHWGVSVTTLDGTVLCAINQAQLFRPASNNKLFTMAAALALLGPERRFTTKVVAEGDLTDGKLHGNLRLLGGGDANFGAHDIPYLAPALRPANPQPEPPTIADIEDLAAQIVATGLKSIDGDIIGDDSWFAWEPYPRGWTIDDLNTDYGAPVSALMIHDSIVEIDASPGAVATVPDVPYYAIENDSTLGAANQGCGLRLERELGSRSVVLYGSAPVGSKPCRVLTAIHDPAEYAALALKAALERQGVQVRGAAVAHHAPLRSTGPIAKAYDDVDTAIRTTLAKADPTTGPPVACPGTAATPQKLLATHQSPALGDDLYYTEKASDNLHAEILLRNLGAAFMCQHSESADLLVMRSYLKQIGIAPEDLVLYDGSGLSGHDLVTPRSLTQLLVYATMQKWADSFKAALPIGGVDGTLASRFAPPNSTLRGKVLAKTGTLGESRDLSGYLTAASGSTIVFSVLVDNHLPSGGADRVAMDKIVEAIAAGN
jgi:D-alanyl-D-alanine carboxypeptidase/D-alanyl-D-alanine-endopeptidase (penicillin-binding protein 4)